MESDIVERLRGASSKDYGCQCPKCEAAFETERLRVKVAAIEAMGYEWRWTRSIDENGQQVGAWVMRHDAAEADAEGGGA